MKNTTCLLRSKLLSIYDFIATPMYIYIDLSISGNEKNVKPPLENKDKFRRTARRTVI